MIERSFTLEYIIKEYAIVEKCLDFKAPSSNAVYRLFKYTEIAKFDENTVLYNMLTGAMIILSKQEKEVIEKLPCKYSHEMDELIRKKFLVSIDTNDKLLYEQIRNVVVLFKDNTITGYNILTTTACNARCFYCFEAGTKFIDMTDKVAEDVADYIIKNVKNKKENVHIHWFGGEPLYNIKPIDIIVDKLIQNNIGFSSRITTNGYLLNEEIIKRAKEKWKLKHIQITLDGTEKVYNRVKNYIYDGVNAFETVINNIGLILNYEIDLRIRLNMDSYNKDDLMDLVDFLENKFGHNKYLHIYSHLLFENCGFNKKIRNDDVHKKSSEDFRELESYIRSKGYFKNIMLPKLFDVGGCMASRDDTIMVMPDGHLGKCENYVDKEFVGSIYEENMDMNIINSWKIPRNSDAKCENCKYYPRCYITAKCPNIKLRACDEYNFLIKKNDLITRMKNEYIEYLKNKN